MKDWQFVIVVISVGVALISIAWGIMWLKIAEDLGNKIGFLEQDIIEYKWQLEEAYYICQERR